MIESDRAKFSFAHIDRRIEGLICRTLALRPCRHLVEPSQTTFPANVEVGWDQFKEAFRGHFIPPGLMAFKHTEFMKLTQGNKSLNEYLSQNHPNYKSTSIKTIIKVIKFSYLSPYNSGSPMK
jgi:hypothetical protein